MNHSSPKFFTRIRDFLFTGQANFMLLALVLATAFINLSCGKKTENHQVEGLDFTVVPSEVLLLPGSTHNCTDMQKSLESRPSSIQQEWFKFNSFQLRYTNPNADATITSIKINFKSSQIEGGEFKTTLSSEEIGFLVGYAEGVIPKVDTTDAKLECPTIPGTKCREIRSDLATTKGNFSACGLAVGGIKPKSDSISFSALGTMTIDGYTMSTDSTVQRFRYEKSFTVSRGI